MVSTRNFNGVIAASTVERNQPSMERVSNPLARKNKIAVGTTRSPTKATTSRVRSLELKIPLRRSKMSLTMLRPIKERENEDDYYNEVDES